MFSKNRSSKDGLVYQCKQCCALYRKKNKDMYRKSSLKYWDSNREACNEKARERSKTIKGHLISKAKKLNRRAKGGIVTAKDLKLLRAMNKTLGADGWVCEYCNKEVDSYHIDHRIPIVKGGKSELRNLSISCARCNLSKGDKLLSEWSPTL